MTSKSNPLVSIVVPVYRNQPYLEPALKSILAQDYEPLEIIIQDDASPDDAFDVVKRVVDAFDGPHNVIIGKNKVNQSMANFNVLMKKASAEYIITMHDDDIQFPDRTSQFMDAFLKHGVSMVTSNAMHITSVGEEIGSDDAAQNQRIDAVQFAKSGWTHMVQGPCLSWHRDVFEKFGPINIEGTARASDWIIPYRAALLNGIYYLRNPTLNLRVHVNSRGSIGRNTDDPDIYSVENSSESLTQLVYMLKTTDHALKLELIDQDTHNVLVPILRDSIISRADEIARSRNKLHMRKMRMAWIPHSAGAVTSADVKDLLNDGQGEEAKSKSIEASELPQKLLENRQQRDLANAKSRSRTSVIQSFWFRFWMHYRKALNDKSKPD